MTTAAMAALWLRDCLGAGTKGLTRRYFKGVTRIIDVPWAITVGNDLRFPHVPGPRTWRMRLLNAYLPRLHRAATLDTVVGGTFLKVANFLGPPRALLSCCGGSGEGAARAHRPRAWLRPSADHSWMSPGMRRPTGHEPQRCRP
jgi:hypothetical protein